LDARSCREKFGCTAPIQTFWKEFSDDDFKRVAFLRYPYPAAARKRNMKMRLNRVSILKEFLRVLEEDQATSRRLLLTIKRLNPEEPIKSADCSTKGKPLKVRPPKFQSIRRGAFASTTTNQKILKGSPQR